MARCRYVKIATRIWRDEKFSLLSEKGKILYLYLLTTHHSNMAGYYLLPDLYVMEDLKWRRATLNKGFEELFKSGMVCRCTESCVVLVPRYFKYNRIENSNQARGVNQRVLELPANSLVEGFKAACKNYCARYYETLIKGLPQGLPEGFIKGLPKGLPKGFTKGFAKGLPEGFAKPFGEELGKGFAKPETEAVTEPEPEPETEAEADSVAEAETEKETAAENFPAASSEELKILNVIKEVKSYPFDFVKDLGFLRELKKDFSRLNILEEVKKWKVYKLDKPLKKNSNARSQLRNWLTKAEEWRAAGDDSSGNGTSGNGNSGNGSPGNGNPGNGREYRNELVLSERQMKLGGLTGEKC